MILTCPNCTTRFLLSAQALAPDGRTVKCSNCEQEWFETPDEDELFGGSDDGADGTDTYLTQEHEDIPDAIKPFNEYVEEHQQNDADTDEQSKTKEGGRAAGYLAAAVAGVAVFGALLALKPAVYTAFPASAGFYHMFGFDVSVPGEGLVFDRVKVNALNEESILIEGTIINKTSEIQTLHPIEASIRDEAGKVIDKTVLRPPSNIMDAESGLPFRTVYQGDVEQADHVQLHFVLNADKEEEGEPKTVSEDGGNTPAPPEDAHADPHGDAAH